MSGTGDVTAGAATDQVLEFRLGEETYCVEIRFVAEIVDAGELTPVPNAPPEVEGMMDLRGRTTSIVDPKHVFNIDEGEAGERIVVFDEDAVGVSGATGWLVDEVVQVVEVNSDNVEAAPVADDDAVHGVVRRDDDLVIWVRPDAVHS